MLQKFRKSKWAKVLAAYLVVCLVFQVAAPTAAWALTGGPSQPEVQSFEPIGTSEMVDPFSGDFTYNIPLIDVGGYPINISYNAGPGMDEEASWVGLGWNINVGVINRNMRAVPDDFDGDEVKKEFNIKENRTYGVNSSVELGELFAIDLGKIGLGLSVGLGVSYNNYNGVGLDASIEPSISASKPNKGTMTGSLGLSASSETGVGVTPSLSFEKKMKDKDGKEKKFNSKIGLDYNSRAGLQGLTIEATYTPKQKTKKVLGSHGKKTMTVQGSINGGADISFSTPSYTPQITMPITNASLSLSATVGGEIYGWHPDLRLTGYFSGQFLLRNSENLPAYGYLNIQNGAAKDKVMLDFNRENDGSFTEHKPNLPVFSSSYDIYSVAGQGIGGMYRPFRNDIGVWFDSKMQNLSGGLNIPGIEIGGGNGFHLGANFSVNAVHSKSGKWSDDNSVKDKLVFRGSANDAFYEAAYFKQAGEKTVDSDRGFLASIGDYDPVRIKLNPNTEDVPATSFYERYPNGVATTPQTLAISPINYRKKRQPRNESISTLTAAEATNFGLEKDISDYGTPHVIDAQDYIVQNGVQICNPNKGKYKHANISRTSHPAHHTSEIITTRADGARYVFGLPAYNTLQEDVSFAIDGSSADCKTGLVWYNHGSDNSLGNTHEQDHFYSKTTMPAFAHSYLLTAIISPDYVDVTGNGPSDDDLGSYTKFNYTRAVAGYKWRVPFQKDMANYSEGLKSLDNDEKASYIYGEKDVWYLNSIETKTHVAEFELGNRADGFEVQNSQGGRGLRSMKLLKQIRLYAKPERIKNQAAAVPLKIVHFEYDYSQCPGLPNNDYPTDHNSGIAGIQDPNGFLNQGGKLTLKKLWFSYQNSFQGYLTPYDFVYGEVRQINGNNTSVISTVNPEYNLKGYDRWGHFKENLAYVNCNADPATSPLSTAEFSYVDQEPLPQGQNYDINNGLPDRTRADINATAWCLTTINTPSGGKIKVDYEADDYAYVQDKQAMQMFKVVGATNGVPTMGDIGQNALQGGLLNVDPNNYLIVKLSKAYPDGTPDSRFVQDFLFDKQGNPIENLYFRFLMNLEKSGSTPAYDFVSGYAKIDFGASSNGFIQNSGNAYTHAYIKLKDAEIQDKAAVFNTDINPVVQASLNHAKLYNPRLAFAQSDPAANAALQIMQSMVALFESVNDFATGYNRSARREGYSKYFVPDKSWVRLYNPDGFKQGGGCRVKRIVMTDEWQALTSNSNYSTAQYGQEYDYTTTDDFGRVISSGVAAYEPALGGDENPWKEPVFYLEKHLLAPNDDYYLEKPFGEGYFPGASVGYSKVTVQNLQYANVTRHATGKVVHEFYTGKDFPVRVLQTPLDPVRKKPNPVLKFLKIKDRDFMTASQGYSIELNDMHGKPKSQMVYAENKAEPISGMRYTYEQSGAKRLSNEVFTMDRSGSIKKQTVGVDYDFAVDMREDKTTSRNGSLHGNLDAFLAAILPVAIPIALPGYSQSKVRFRSAVATKVINRYGLLKETLAFDLGSQVSTENMVYDSETGEVLLTKTINQFDDPVYAFTYPAHWAYEGMGPAYKNIGLVVPYAQATGNPAAYFVEGDEVTTTSSTEKGWVTKTSGALTVLKADGSPLPLGSFVKVLRSGRRNQQSSAVGGVTTLANPLLDTNSDGNPDVLAFNKVLNASAIEFTDQWGLFCNCGIKPGDIYNPYFRGAKGNFRQKRSFLHLTQRSQSRLNNNTSIRTDGIYTSFNPFWVPPATGNTWTPDYNNWTFTAEVTIVDPYGMELENMDALKRYSAAIYGFNHTLPAAVSANARYREVGFDSFEDYDACNCSDDHFSFESVQPVITEKESHSGRRSIVLQPGAAVEIRKVVEPCPKDINDR